jgi:hypothetical protein
MLFPENLPELVPTLEKIKGYFSLPVDSGCEIHHEDVPRDPSGLPLVPFSPTEAEDYLPQCPSNRRHFGCPHFWDEHEEEIRDSMHHIYLRTQDDEIDMLSWKLSEHFEKILLIDKRVRFARTVSMTSMIGDKNCVPNKKQADERSSPILQEYHQKCDELELCRQIILQKIEDLLSAANARSLEAEAIS